MAIAYIAGMLALGDVLAQRFLPTTSLLHRVCAAILVGLLVSTWFTYTVASVFGGLESPLLIANISFFALLAFALRRLPGRLSRVSIARRMQLIGRQLRHERRDFIWLGVLTLLAIWLSVMTFRVEDGDMKMSFIVWSDFGSTTAISQSFAVGNNFPTVLPHFPGEPIRYHFLFFFQAGNLTFLGLDPALSFNLLGVLALSAMLGLVITLGRVLFRSSTAGWLAAGLFFFHGSLSWIRYVTSQPSVDALLADLGTRRNFLPSGFPFRGEEWGVWSMSVYANQRHFASAIGILLLVLLFLLARWRTRRGDGEPWRQRLARLTDTAAWRQRLLNVRRQLRPSYLTGADFRPRDALSFGFAGLLLGALPMWNGAVFVSSFVVLGALFLLMPDRRYMLVLAAGAALAALPQLELVRPSGINVGYPDFYWGYVVDDPTPARVLNYFVHHFGPKILLAVVALTALSLFELKFFVAMTTLVVLTLTVKFSAEVLVNGKFLNVWLVVLNVFAAYAIMLLWRTRSLAGAIVGRTTALALVGVIVIGGLIDLAPFNNARTYTVAYKNDELADWVKARTEPDDVFLSDWVVTHPVLTSGRSVFFGWPYNALSAGYAVRDREAVWAELYSETDPVVLTRMLRANGIDYVIYDDDVRTRGRVENLNEQVFEENFLLVFEDPDFKRTRIYSVP